MSISRNDGVCIQETMSTILVFAPSRTLESEPLPYGERLGMLSYPKIIRWHALRMGRVRLHSSCPRLSPLQGSILPLIAAPMPYDITILLASLRLNHRTVIGSLNISPNRTAVQYTKILLLHISSKAQERKLSTS
jgi:hypothetical protein